MMKFKIKSALLYLFLFLGLSSLAENDCFPKKDNSNRILVYDESDIFSPSEERALNQRLVQISNNTSNQIVVVVVNDLCGMDQAMYATDLGQAWGVGTKGQDNGIVILIKPTGGKGNRRTFIAVGYGLEGVIPDATAKLVVENEMIPNFKNGQFYKGVDAALDVLVPLAKQEFNYRAYGDKVRRSKDEQGGFMILVVLLFVVFYLLARISSSRKYAQTNGTGFWTAFMMGSLLGGMGGSSNRGGWDDFNSGGGGFGGFGGGGFGGGGAGGSW